MGKTSSVNVATPSFSGGSISVNGKNKAVVSQKGNMINSDYSMNDYEKAVYDYAQMNLANMLPKLNVFDNQTKRDLKSQVEAYKLKAMKSLDDMYKPMLNNLTNNVASRFGNIDNSQFLEGLNSIENYRANALTSLAQDIQNRQNELINNELSNRYNYINLLNTLVNGTNSNMLNYLSSALSNSQAGNDFNSNIYKMNLANTLNASKMNNSSNLNNLQSLMGLMSVLGL